VSADIDRTTIFQLAKARLRKRNLSGKSALLPADFPDAFTPVEKCPSCNIFL